jgi:hypothetical protein
MPTASTLAMVAVDAGLVVLAWLVQLVIYPAFVAVSSVRFRPWHRWYSRRIGFVVLPLMVAQVVLHGVAIWRAPDPIRVAAAVCILAAWLATFLGAVPCHRALQAQGFQLVAHRQLLRWNLVRSVAWTATLALALAGLLQ